MADRLKPSPVNPPVEPGEAQTRSAREIAAELNAAALKARNSQRAEARRLYQQAYELARQESSCLAELAASLAGLANLNNDAGEIDLAVNQNFEAISLLVNCPPAPALVDAYCNLTWMFFSFGDFRNALEYASKALSLARELQDPYWEARALDTYGHALMVDIADVDEIFTFQERAAQLYGEAGDYSEQARVYNNIADVQMRGNKLETALEFGQKSLALSKELASPIVETIAAITLAEVLIAKGEFAQAENYLRETLGQFSRETPVLFKTYILTALAQIQLIHSQTDQAEASLLEAIKIATNVKSPYDQAIAHRTLAEVYEQTQAYSKAIEHLKIYIELNEKLLNERAAKQFYALKVASQLEAAQHEAEIQRLKTVELQNEIDERTRIQKELEKLATTDSLTGLYNRRHFFHLAEHEIERVRRFNQTIAVVLIDIDDFKHVNDTYGHLIGDLVLNSIANIFQACTRSVDLVCRYGGEEFAILMPETEATKSKVVIQRMRKKLEDQGIQTEFGSISITFSAGIASLGSNKTSVDLELLIKRADQALYDAKRAGKNKTIISLA